MRSKKVPKINLSVTLLCRSVGALAMVSATVTCSRHSQQSVGRQKNATDNSEQDGQASRLPKISSSHFALDELQQERKEAAVGEKASNSTAQFSADEQGSTRPSSISF
jgi:hypothetical protein